jgi:Family of unknown function (DUF6326)
MNRSKSTSGIDPKVKLSLLWLFVVLNMAYADILSLMEPTSPIRKIMAGAPMPAGGLLAGAVLMETAIVMVILSWVLSYKVNRWVNIVIGAVNMLAIVTGGHGLYYVFGSLTVSRSFSIHEHEQPGVVDGLFRELLETR